MCIPLEKSFLGHWWELLALQIALAYLLLEQKYVYGRGQKIKTLV